MRKKREKNEKIILPKYKITNIHIEELKGLKNLDIQINKNLVAIMGVNGCGKSTILHALACCYSPYEKGEDYKFSYFFTPNTDSNWQNSNFLICNYDERSKKQINREYRKDYDRWAPRYTNRLKRDVHYLGIVSCIPEIENEKQTSFIHYNKQESSDAISKKVLEDAAFILNKNYSSFSINQIKKKNKYLIGVSTVNKIAYSSLSMGAGEQRVISMLKLLYEANQYSLILIDEIDLLLHVTAFKRLIKKVHDIAKKRNLQVFFTTHSLVVTQFEEFIDIRYLDNLPGKTMVYNSINSDMIYDLSEDNTKPLEIFVEDSLAEIIIKCIARDLNVLSKVNVKKFGAAGNAFVLAASYVIKEENCDNTIVVLDGDLYNTDEEKIIEIKNTLSGTEKDHDEKVDKTLTIIKDLNLPKNMTPEEYIYNLLLEEPNETEIIKQAKKINAVADKHQWIDKLVEYMGHEKQYIISHIIDVVSKNEKWIDYTRFIREWLENRKAIV